MNGFGFDGKGDNCCLWILIILLILCVCKSGILSGIFSSGCCLPIAIAIIFCLCKNGGGNFFNGLGYGCK